MLGDEVQFIPAAWPLQTRDGLLTSDSRMTNVLVEKDVNGDKISVKRPGLQLIQNLPPGTGQGMCLCGGNPYAIVGDTIYNALTGALVGAIPGVTVPGEQFDVLSDTPVSTSIIKTSHGAWIFTNGTTITKITDPNYPLLTVPGITYLDGIYYVMEATGVVRGSALEAAGTWPALNFIQADHVLGVGGSIIRHLNYIVGFYSLGTQMFYDANSNNGDPTAGTALAPVLNASWTTGIAIGSSAREINDTTFFMAKNIAFGRTICAISGLNMQQISTPWVEKILARSSASLANLQSFALKTAGHTLYGFTMLDIGVTLVYDQTSGDWNLWTSNNVTPDGPFAGYNYLGTNFQDLFLDLTSGIVSNMSQYVGNDHGSTINMRIVTDNFVLGSQRVKQFAQMLLHSDTVNATMQFRYTDDDYQTWSPYRTINLATVQKRAQRMGRSRRRAYEFLFTADVAGFRFDKVEFNVSFGPS